MITIGIFFLSLVFFFAIDVTQQVNARKATEANLRTVLESLYQISWTSLPDGTINYFNRQFYDFTGLTRQEAFGEGWPAFVHPTQAGDISREWNEAIKQKMDFQKQLLLKDKQTRYRWHLATSSKVTDDKGDIVYWIVSCTDIHDQKLFTAELEKQVSERTEELVKSNAELMHSNSDLEQFASIASHDLQEPLRKIITFVALLNQNYSGKIPEAAMEYLHKIRNSSDRMAQLIHELLEYSKIIHADKKFKSIDMDRTIRNVLSDLDLMISETNAVINYEKPLPAIEANALQMNQLFYNLLTNSLKFFKSGHFPEITISYRCPSIEEITSYGLADNREYGRSVAKSFQ